MGSVAGRSERIENVSEVMESLKSKYTDISEDELRNKATESLIKKGIKIATEVARKKGIYGSQSTKYILNIIILRLCFGK